MGKWAARLAEKAAAPHYVCTDETDKRGVLSVLAVTPKGSADAFHVPSKVESEPAEKPNTLNLAAVAWTDADIARFLDRRARLIRWRWTEPEAEKLAERLVKRDREQDDRVNCADCRHCQPGRCGNHRRAGLSSPTVGRELVRLLQRCSGFQTTRPAAAS